MFLDAQIHTNCARLLGERVRRTIEKMTKISSCSAVMYRWTGNDAYYFSRIEKCDLMKKEVLLVCNGARYRCVCGVVQYGTTNVMMHLCRANDQYHTNDQ